jgi:hypothetical protein
MQCYKIVFLKIAVLRIVTPYIVVDDYWHFWVTPDVSVFRSSTPVVTNLWYTYHWGYAADRLGVRENKIGNTKKKELK